MKISKKLSIFILLTGFMLPVLAQTTGSLSFSCSTYAPTGSYGLKHVAAVWIQNNENPSVFIKTDAKYGRQDDHLTSWSAISGKNMVDAVSGATLTSYGTITVEWDGTDVSHNVVMDGNYSIYIEMGWGKDKVKQHAVYKFDFTKGVADQELTPDSTENFYNVSLSWKPVSTLISAVEGADGVCIFPNPSKGAINLNFQKELNNVKLEIADISGKLCYTESLPQLSPGLKTLDLSDLPASMYVLKVSSDESYFTYKIIRDK